MSTYQECLFAGKEVIVVSMVSKGNRIHSFVKPYVGHVGIVEREAKNGMLLVKFTYSWCHYDHYRAIPSGCVKILETVKFA